MPGEMTTRRNAVSWHSQIAGDFDAKYASSPSFRERLTVWASLIENFAHAQARILDAGCGTGVLAFLAARRARSVIGFDASPEMIALAEAKKRNDGCDNVSFHIASLENLASLQQHRFDLILCSSVLEYIDDYWDAIDALAAHLAPGGVMIFSLPNGRSLYRRAERLIFHLTGRPAYYAYVRHVPTLASVREELSARSFELLESRFYAAAPILSHIARRLGYPELADNLFVVACRRPSAQLGNSS
jgi:2-polyprenyl-6-hydroxyphenyl methylase/3-demethylubiquinone-9 3-methyltransferase